MTKEEIKELDILREERRDLDYFISGSGALKIKTVSLFKFYGCGTHEIEITNKNTALNIIQILNDRLNEINDTIEKM